PDPFAPTEPTVPELALTLERAALPPTIARYNLPDSEEMFEVVAEPTAMIDVASLPDDEWLKALPTQVTTSAPVVPAAYSASAPVVELSPPPEPMQTADGFSPGSRGIGIVIQKSQPQQARVGELIWYDLT